MKCTYYQIQGELDLVRVSGEFELSEFELIIMYSELIIVHASIVLGVLLFSAKTTSPNEVSSINTAQIHCNGKSQIARAES
jgi:hypothetical protein